VPTIDLVVEEDKMKKKLQEAIDSTDPKAWKVQAQALLQLGQLEKWKGNIELADYYMTESAKLCRLNTISRT